MKKLLSLLSVLTISGTAVPTTVAVSPYQKEETIKNIDINQQTNKKRAKRNTEITNNIYFVDENGGVRKETDVPYPITTMYVFKDPDSGQRKYGDIYFGNDLYYKKESGEIKKHNLFGLVEGKIIKIEKDLDNNFYILLNNKKLWKSDYNFTSIQNGEPISINNDSEVKDFIIDKFNNIFVLTQNNNVYYKKQNNNQFNKLNIFTKSEQIYNIFGSKKKVEVFI